MGSMPKLLLIFFIIFVCRNLFAQSPSQIGACIQDPNADALQKEWKHYHEVKKKRAHINTALLVQNIRMDHDTLKLVQAISEVENLMNIIDELENKYFLKAFVDTRFNELIAHPDFMVRLSKKEVDTEIHASELKFKDDPYFYQLLDKIRAEIAKPEITEAIELFRIYDLGILEKNYRKSAKSALKLIRQKGATKEAVRNWLNDPPYLRNVPYPSVKLGPFAIRYRTLLVKSVAIFVQERVVTLAEAQKIYSHIKAAEVNEINTLLPPTEKNSFDDHIAKLLSPSDAAIDGVARTLWGEASSCESMGLAQFEAIGRIIADRSLAVKRSLEEQTFLEKKSEEVREQNWAKVLKNWVGISRPAPGLKNKPIKHLKGLSDFGRKEKLDLLEAAQVISKKGQFSVWNSFAVKHYHTGQFQQNIPDAVYEIQGPQAENDDRALVRILCPQFQTREQKDLWSKAIQIASDIVLGPEILAKKIKWPVNGDILFYTHDAALPFAKEIKVPHLLVDNKKVPLRGKGHGACNRFRLFMPKNKNQY